MGGLASNVLPVLLDPLNITGVQDGPIRGRPGGPPEPHLRAYPLPQQAGEKPKGFFEGLGIGGAGDRVENFLAPAGAESVPPPPPQWSYVQGKGPAWQTHERQGATNNFTPTPNFAGSAGFNSKGNRF